MALSRKKGLQDHEQVIGKVTGTDGVEHDVKFAYTRFGKIVFSTTTLREGSHDWFRNTIHLMEETSHEPNRAVEWEFFVEAEEETVGLDEKTGELYWMADKKYGNA